MLALVLMIALPITIFLFCTNAYFTSASMKKVVNSIDSEQIKEQMSSELLNIAEENKEWVNALYETDMVKDGMAIALGNIGEYIRTGKDAYLISEKEYQTLIDTYLEEAVQKYNPSITKQEKEEIENAVQGAYQQFEEEMPKASDLGKEVEVAETFQIMQKICSPKARYLSLGITVSIIIVLILLQRKRWNFILYTSIPTIISTILIEILCYIVGKLIKQIDIGTGVASSISEALLFQYVNALQITGLVLCMLAIFALVFLKMMRKKERAI